MSARTHHTTPTSGHCHRNAQKKGSINSTRGPAKRPWELKRGCGVAALLRRYCGERLLSGPAFWGNGSRASALHMPLDICPQHVIPISKYTQVSSYWLLFHSRFILSDSVSKSSTLFPFSLVFNNLYVFAIPVQSSFITLRFFVNLLAGSIFRRYTRGHCDAGSSLCRYTRGHCDAGLSFRRYTRGHRHAGSSFRRYTRGHCIAASSLRRHRCWHTSGTYWNITGNR